MHILLVEDDDRVAAALLRHGMITTRLSAGRDVVQHLTDVDVVLLDLGLPARGGRRVPGDPRGQRPAGDRDVRPRRGRRPHPRLHSGADDYPAKPYDIGELVARVHAVYRRRRVAVATAEAEVITVGGVALDLSRHTVTVDGTPVALSHKEFQVLAMLATAGGAVCTRSRIVAEVWGRGWPGANRTLDVRVAMLRTKLGHPELVQTVRGVGYRFALVEPGTQER